MTYRHPRWSRIRRGFQQARDYLDFSKMNIQIYGTPTEDVVEQMRQLAGSGVPVTIKTPVTGFDRIG